MLFMFIVYTIGSAIDTFIKNRNIKIIIALVSALIICYPIISVILTPGIS